MKCLSSKDLVSSELRLKGVAKIRLLHEGEVAQLLADYQSKFAGIGGENGFYWSMADRDKRMSAAANDYLTEKVFPLLMPFFGNIQSIVSSFFVKEAEGDFINPHQDWTFIDGEPEAASYTCWIPLVNTDYNSGTMGFVIGSHRLTNYVRASPSVSFPDFTMEQRRMILENTEYVNMEAGEAVVFNHRAIHSSSPNRVKAQRPAIGICFAPAPCRMIHYYRNPKTPDTVFKYSVNRDFYNQYNNENLSELFGRGEAIPGYTVLEETGFRAVTDAELDALMAEPVGR